MRVAGLIAATEAEPAANLLGHTLGVVEGLGLELPSYAMRRRDQILTTLRERLDEETLTRALERGHAMSLEAAVELALKDRSLAE
jgi:hypothetical protein